MYPGGLCRVLLSFSAPFSLILLNLERNRFSTRKEIKFWIDILIINSGEELSFTETWFQFGCWRKSVYFLKLGKSASENLS